jgi:hypothetical protein
VSVDHATERIAGHEVRIEMMSTNIKELSDHVRELEARTNTMWGMGIGLGALLTIIQTIGIIADRKISKAAEVQQHNRTRG